jgi:hypothetical protein
MRMLPGQSREVSSDQSSGGVFYFSFHVLRWPSGFRPVRKGEIIAGILVEGSHPAVPE